MRPKYTGWWDVFSVVLDPPTADDYEWLMRWEAAAVAGIAREHGGVASGPGGGHADTVLRSFTRVGLVHPRFMCTALAAAGPEAAAGLVTDLEALVHQYDGTSRAPVAALVHGLAVED